MAEYRIYTGYQFRNAIDRLGDTDSYVTTLIDGLTYAAGVSGADSGGGTLGDPNLTLTDSAGNVLLTNDDVSGTSRDSQLVFTAGTTGNFNLIVGEQGNNATGSYTLSLTRGFASNNNDQVGGTSYGDAIDGMGGNDLLNGWGGNDALYGANGDDTLIGAAGNDRLIGGYGNDVLRGGAGNDWLTGNGNADRLIGGTSADVFDFNFTSDSIGGVDVIAAGDGAAAFQGVGVAGGDVIDLRDIDANVNVGGNQAFTWSLSKAAGTVHLANSYGNTVLYAYTDNDVAHEFAVIIADGAGVRAADYATNDFLL